MPTNEAVAFRLSTLLLLCLSAGCEPLTRSAPPPAKPGVSVLKAAPFVLYKSSQDRVPDGDTLYPPLSYDGRIMAFYSRATNLVPDDTNRAGDVFVLDRGTSEMRRASVASDGSQADGESTYPSISGNGRHIAFTSKATNLVPADTNVKADIFVTDLMSGATVRASVSSTGQEANDESYTYFPSISADGRIVVFSSNATNLVPNDANGTWDVFVRDLSTQQTRRVSVGSDGTEANGASMHAVVSGNGRYVAFHSRASNLTAGDNNGAADIFVYDRRTGQPSLVSRTRSGAVGNGRSERPSISHDGRWIAFSSDASDLVEGDGNQAEDVFVFDTRQNETIRASLTFDGKEMERAVNPVASDRKSVISPDGRFVAFRSDASNLVTGDTNGEVDIFLRDLRSNTTKRISVGPGNVQRAGLSEHHALSWEARVVAFSSERGPRPRPNAPNAPGPLVAPTAPISDVFVFENGGTKIERAP
jgi:Tol biopolymer transport system component